MLEFLLTVCVLSIAVPVTVFVTVQLGVYGFLLARHRFSTKYLKRSDTDGG